MKLIELVRKLFEDENKTGRMEDDLLILYERMYFNEIEMREKLYARSQIPLAIIVAMIGIVIYIFKNISVFQSDFLSVSFIVLFLTTIFFLGRAIFCFIKSWYGYEYKFLPSAVELENYREEISKLYNPYSERDIWIPETIKGALLKYYTEFATTNGANNDARSAYLHRTSKFLIVSFIFGVLTMPAFYFSKCNDGKDNFRRVEIVNLSATKGDAMTDKPKPPPPPPGKVIKEGNPKPQTPKK